MSGDYQKLVGKAELMFVGLVRSEFERAPDLPQDIEDLQKFMREELVGGPSRSAAEADGVEEIMCTIRCRVWADPTKFGNDVAPEESYESARFKISATYAVLFFATDAKDLSDEAVTTFCDRVGMMSVWPYFRSHCSHYANESAIALPTLPLKKAVYPIKETGPGPLFSEVSDKSKQA